MNKLFPCTRLSICGVILISSMVLFSCETADRKTGPSFQGKPNIRYAPAEYHIPTPQRIEYEDAMITVAIYARSFSQGDAAYIEIAPKSPVKTITLSFRGTSIPLSRKSWGYRGLFAIPSDLKPGDYRCIVSSVIPEGTRQSTISFKVSDAHFRVFRKALDLGSFSDESRS